MTPFNIVFLYYFLLKKIYQQINVYVKYIFLYFNLTLNLLTKINHKSPLN